MKNLTQKLCFLALLFSSFNAYCQVPKLSSNNDYLPTIFLDFDGQTVQSGAWQGGNTFVCDAAVLTTAQITEIFNRVSEDYRPFNVNVTTDSAKYFLAPVTQRARIIVTPTSDWFQGVGGIAYIGSFSWGDDTPGFVFTNRLANSPKYIAECCTHESGHTVGLSHQSTYNASCVLTEPYCTGSGANSDETSWAPVMGNSYYKNMTGWSNGPTPDNCSSLQDNLTIITTQNGFGYRADDYTDLLNANTTAINEIAFNKTGVITTPYDKDPFKLLISQAGNIHFEATPYNIGTNNLGANLDVMVLLYNSNNVLIRTYNPLNTMKVVVDTSLSIGTYYLVILGAGNNNTTNYGSLGSYSFTGFKGALPIHNVALQGNKEGSTHRLFWDVISDEVIVKQLLEVSANGIDFKPLLNDVTGVKKFSYTSLESGTQYYRLKVTSIINQSMYSNIVAIKSSSNSNHLFEVSTLVQQTIKVSAPVNYTYSLYDANARLMSTGKKLKGNTNIDVQAFSKGIYVLQIISDNYKQTERIIKQ